MNLVEDTACDLPNIFPPSAVKPIWLPLKVKGRLLEIRNSYKKCYIKQKKKDPLEAIELQ